MKAIAAMTRNRVIGNGNKLVWHNKEDMFYFKNATWGCPIIMGRKTYESIGKPLPGRLNIVVSKGATPSGVLRADNVDMFRRTPLENAWVIGGAQIYKELLPHCSDLYLTVVDQEVEGDAFLPDFEDFFKEKSVEQFNGYKRIHYVQKSK